MKHGEHTRRTMKRKGASTPKHDQVEVLMTDDGFVVRNVIAEALALNMKVDGKVIQGKLHWYHKWQQSPFAPLLLGQFPDRLVGAVSRDFLNQSVRIIPWKVYLS